MAVEFVNRASGPAQPPRLDGGRFTAIGLRRCLALLVLSLAQGLVPATAASPTSLAKADLGERFLLQVNYEQESSHQDFMTSRSRIVRFRRQGEVLRMTEETAGSGSGPHLLARIPIDSETPDRLALDFNKGFDRIYYEEDRTGEDYYGRVARPDYRSFRLFDRTLTAASRHGATLVLDQEARKDDGEPVRVHYYLSPYRPDADFQPFEMKDLDHFGFYETYPRRKSGRWVLYAMKFDVHRPIVFALSASIPERYRDAVRDGVRYWNRALGMPLLTVVDAPPGVQAPDPDYNVIQWVADGDYSSTSHIQSDPLTGQILHADVFVLAETMRDGDLSQQNDHLRYIVAHEVGHALGLRHNFAPGPVSTVMNYFNLKQTLRIGRDIAQGKPALPYDRQVMRYVYLHKPVALDKLPPFCTAVQKGCAPFQSAEPVSQLRRAASAAAGSGREGPAGGGTGANRRGV